MPKARSKTKIAIFASGNGSNFEAIVKAVKRGRIKNAQVALLICDREKAFVRRRAEKLKIKQICLLPKDFSSRREYEKEIFHILKKEKIDLVVLAGFMRILSSYLITRFPRRILNIHPSLLPAFAGKDAISRAYDYGVKVSGVTVHIVDEKVDHGPIVMQKALDIKPGWSLQRFEQEIHKIEHYLFPQAVNYFTQNKIKVVKRKVKIV